MESTRLRQDVLDRISTWKFETARLGFLDDVRMSTEARFSCRGFAMTRPDSADVEVTAPQRWTLYRLRACWNVQPSLTCSSASISMLQTDCRTIEGCAGIQYVDLKIWR